MAAIQHLPGRTWHRRRGGPANGFVYGIDYVMLDAEAPVKAPPGFGRNRAGVMSLQDSDHGGPPGRGRGAPWARQVLAEAGLAGVTGGQLLLLAQPRVLGHVFNPVSFWLAHDADGQLRVVIAEVGNTFGDRHSYLCHRDDLAPLGGGDEVAATKLFHVSPFQPIAGGYRFRFDIRPDRLRIGIRFDDGRGGGLATGLQGRLRPLTAGAMLRAGLRRPLGARRVLALIHWQALKLWWKGAPFRSRPAPPDLPVSR